jgi:hypothetical protein
MAIEASKLTSSRSKEGLGANRGLPHATNATSPAYIFMRACFFILPPLGAPAYFVVFPDQLIEFTDWLARLIQ